MNIVTFEDVSKTYRMGEVDVAALDHVSLEIPRACSPRWSGLREAEKPPP